MPAPCSCRPAPGDVAESWEATGKQAWLGFPHSSRHPESRGCCCVSRAVPAAFSLPLTAAITLQAMPPFLLLPLLSPAQKAKSKRLLLVPRGCGQICLWSWEGAVFPHQRGLRDWRVALGLSLAAFRIQLPGWFIRWFRISFMFIIT